MTVPITVLIHHQEQRSLSRDEWRGIVEKMIESIVNSPVTLSFDKPGRPYIDYPGAVISYSHTKDTLVLAFARSGIEVGIDAEIESRASDIKEIRDTAFSEEERYPPESDLISNWCLKEAAMKMTGRGFYDYDPRSYCRLLRMHLLTKKDSIFTVLWESTGQNIVWEF